MIYICSLFAVSLLTRSFDTKSVVMVLAASCRDVFLVERRTVEK